MEIHTQETGQGQPSEEGAGTVQEVTETQSGVPETSPSSEEGTGSTDTPGQGFLEPYLKEMPEDQRAIVEPVLEKYRQDQDRNVNQRFESLKKETEIPTLIYESLLSDPIQTLDWIADRLQEEQGLDVRSEIKNRWFSEMNEANQQSGQENNAQSGQEDKPLTQTQLNAILEQREQDHAQEQQRQAQQQQQAEQQQTQVNSWIDHAASSLKLELDDSQGEDPMRALIIMQANRIHESGTARGQAAVEMATEAVAKRFGKFNSGGSNTGNQPNVAKGGTPPPSPDFNVQDSKQRKSRMLEFMTSSPEN